MYRPDRHYHLKTTCAGFALGDIAIDIPEGLYWQKAPLGYNFGMSYTNWNWKPNGTLPHMDKEYWHMAFMEGYNCTVQAEIDSCIQMPDHPMSIEAVEDIRGIGFRVGDILVINADGAVGRAIFYANGIHLYREPEDGEVWSIGMHAAFKTAELDEEGDPLYLILEVYKSMDAKETVNFIQNPQPLLELAPFSTVLAGIHKINK